jgi:hypothetical protein
MLADDIWFVLNNALGKIHDDVPASPFHICETAVAPKFACWRVATA